MVVTDQQLSSWLEEHRKYTSEGHVARYIPALSRVDSRLFSITIFYMDGKQMEAGDTGQLFTLQSISKVIALIYAFERYGMDSVFEKIGMEHTGDPFNSLFRLELHYHTKPLNPMINAGAIAISSMLAGRSAGKSIDNFLDFVQRLTGNQNMMVDYEVYQSEMETAYRNRSLAYLLQDLGVIDNVEEALDFYIQQCAIKVSTRDLALIGAIIANHGVSPLNGSTIISAREARVAAAFMMMSGLYNASGEFAIRAGIPTKSGVSGGLMACVPGKLGIGIYSPSLDDKGNSIAGTKLLTFLSEQWQLSIF